MKSYSPKAFVLAVSLAATAAATPLACGARSPIESIENTEDAGIEDASKADTEILDASQDSKDDAMNCINIQNFTADPTSFSPENGQSTAISYFLSETAKIDVTVIDEDRTPIKQLYSSNLQMGGKEYTLIWDGKNYAHLVVPFGTYKVRIRIIDLANTITSECETTINID